MSVDSPVPATTCHASGGMQAPHDVQTVSGSNVATVHDGPVPDHTPGSGALVGPDTASMIGREILGQYRVMSKLGRGGMGTVFLAQQLGMHRQVAIKVLHPDVSAEPDAARRFHIEAQAAARLNSPNIVSVFNFGQLHSGELYLAMEYLPGRSLHAELATYGRMPLQRVVALVGQIARGLDEAHRNGVIHRDLKPGNVMIVPRPEGEVAKLLDFGIAKLDTGSGTQTQGWVGTPRYMAPEQFTGGQVDARTDVYALGLITYEMLCGRSPFLSDNPMSYVHSHVYAAVPTLQSVAPGVVPLAVEAVVLAALAKQAQERPASAGEFARRLAEAVHAPAPRGGSSAKKGAPVAAIVGAAVLGLGVVGGGGAYAYQRFSAERDAVAATESTANDGSAPLAHVPTAAATEFEPDYLAQLPEELRDLVDLDESALMKRLEESFEVYPPSMRKQVKAQYTLQLASMPGPENLTARKVVLINAVVAMVGAQQYLTKDPRSTETLIEDYLTRPGPIPRANRKEIVDTMRKNVRVPEDADWTVRQWLLEVEKQEKTRVGD